LLGLNVHLNSWQIHFLYCHLDFNISATNEQKWF
jgi:hypothetical protein